MQGSKMHRENSMNILEEIAEKTKGRVERQKEIIPQKELEKKVQSVQGQERFLFEKAISGKDLAFICEIKKASPSKGLIAEKFPYLEIAREYEEGGADAVSVLTEPFYFQGSSRYLQEISRTVKLPLLRKDFVVDPYQIFEAKCIGASAVLLICSILDQKQLKEYFGLADQLGLSVLTEAHDEREIEMALSAGVRIIGVNNRDLKTFQVDLNNSIRLRKKVPSEIIFVSESGIRNAEDVRALRENGVNAVLMGETLMRAPDKAAALKELKG